MSASSASDVRIQDRATQIRRVVLEYAQRRTAKDRITKESVIATYPQLMPDLAVELEKLHRIEGAIDEVEDALCARAIVRLASEWSGGSAGGAGQNAPEAPGSVANFRETQQASNASDGENDAAAAGSPGSLIPPTIGRYRVRHLLGEGAFGRVYLAWDAELAREVAVKVSHAYRMFNPESLEGFLAEARNVARLDHPSIVPVYDAGRTADGCCYVVSKWIRGSDLRHQMQRQGLSAQAATGIVVAVADALHYAHQQGLIHRDIKPANILLDTNGTPYVGDFGLALRCSRPSKRRSFAGTPPYMSPEQARGEAHRIDGRSDVFSLGVVLYELLTGSKPFFSELHEQLRRQILWAEPVAPRQCNESIAPELERICLKSLSKRAADRHGTAKELADDLRHYLEVSSRPRILPASAGRGDSCLILAPSAVEPPPPRIVPRGLRPFDASDSKGFLQLVPGPRDRDGLPESIRQWKIRIEQEDPEESFAVGVLYGPSGCGKSSLVRAGLLPRLSAHVHTVYVEATADHTEARVLKKLLRRYPELTADGDLADCLAALRCGCGPAEGSKVLFVVDQFEQWLHGRGEADRRLFVQALRHCDGGRLQCLLLVRDDFWLALSRFMAELEIDLVQRHNAALVDLFDPAHAGKVLAEFGRAFGRLPEDLNRLPAAQQTFLQRAIDGLTDEGKVVPVRLALFAEMVKGKPWNPGTLRDVGGAAGVGVTFLEETFSARTANPQYRLHEKAARAVLEALLPAAGSDMKGRIRSYPELLDLSGYGEKPRAFKELMRILGGETRLIMPGDPEVGGAAGVAAGPGQRFYQLTHDYLVPTLRQWLTRKRGSTPAGRSELRLASRTAMWSAHPERRQLPSLWEWISICLLTRSRRWTEPQRRMMQAAARRHALTTGLLAVIVLAFLFGGLELTGMTRDLLMQLRARSAAVWMAIGNQQAVWPLLKNTPDATLRTRVLHGLSSVVVKPASVLSRVDDQQDVSVRRAMLLVAGQLLGDPAERFDARAGLRSGALPDNTIGSLAERYRNDPDPGIHAAAEWTLRKHGQNDQIARCARDIVSSGPRDDRQWYINSQGHTMVVVPGPTQFLMGAAEGARSAQAGQRPRYRQIRRSFSIASTETTVDQFRKFLDANPRLPRAPEPWSDVTLDMPQTSVTWYEAAAYCNWLSQSEGLPPDQRCYLRNQAGEYAEGMRLAADYLDRRGYRLPTEPEWEYACRAGAATVYSFGTDGSYLKYYGVHAQISGGRPQGVGTKKPNDFGLFDTHGNVSEWCQDRYTPHSRSKDDSAATHSDYALPIGDADNRVLRGGSFSDPAERVHCSARDSARPCARRDQSGFRVARSYP